MTDDELIAGITGQEIPKFACGYVETLWRSAETAAVFLRSWVA